MSNLETGAAECIYKWKSVGVEKVAAFPPEKWVRLFSYNEHNICCLDAGMLITCQAQTSQLLSALAPGVSAALA